jgi:hypothetical protein
MKVVTYSAVFQTRLTTLMRNIDLHNKKMLITKLGYKHIP